MSDQKVKKYVLLKHTEPTANVFIQVSQTQRQRIGSRKHDAPFLQITRMGRDGVNRTIRLKLNCNTIFQDEQIKQHNIPANERFSDRERKAVEFKHGILITKNPVVMKFLDEHPQNEAFWVADKDGNIGYCDSIEGPLFKELNETAIIKNENAEIKKRVEAANRILGLKDVKKLQNLQIRLNGRHFTPSSDQETLENQLMEWLDDADMDGVNEVLKVKISKDEEVFMLVSNCISEKIISFDENPKAVIKFISGGKTAELKDMPEDVALEEKHKLFCDFLMSKSGEAVYEDLKLALKK